MVETVKLGSRGTLILPAKARKRLGIEEGCLLIIEETDRGLLIRPAVAVPVERYSPDRQAEFLLNNAVDTADYAEVRERVRRMGLDPDRIPHEPPAAA